VKPRAGIPGRACCGLLLAGAAFVAQAGASGERLMQAIRDDDLIGLSRALEAGADPNVRLPDGSTPLAWAAEVQDARLVQRLLAAGARTDGVGEPGLAPLMVACERGDAAVLNALLRAGADVRVVREDGISALALCAGRAPTGIVARLLDGGAPVDAADQRGQTPLMHAAAGGKAATIALLVAHGAHVNAQTPGGFTPLFFALKSGAPDAPLAIVAAGGDTTHVASDGTTAVQLAIYQHQYAFAERLVAAGADLAATDRNGDALLHAAVKAGEPTLVATLLKAGADPNEITGNSRVEWRFERNFKTAPYVVPPKSPLILAAEMGAAGDMQALIDAGADAAFRAADGTNVVLAAVGSDSPAALALALRLQPDANVQMADGSTALHLLLGPGTDGSTDHTLELLQLLADHGARTDIPNQHGKTAADIAADPQFKLHSDFEAVFHTYSVTQR